MDGNVEKRIQEFLISFINPDESDLRDFADSLAAENPSIDREELLREVVDKSEMYSGNSTRLYNLETSFSEFSGQNSPDVEEFKQLLATAYDKNSMLQEISDEIGRLEQIIENLKGQQTDATEEQAEASPDINSLLDRIQKLKSKDTDAPAKPQASADRRTEENDAAPKASYRPHAAEMPDEAPAAETPEKVPREKTHASNTKEVPQTDKAGDITESESPEETEASTGDEKEEIRSYGLIDKLSGGKNELTEVLHEKIEERGEQSVKETARGEPAEEKELVKDIMEERLVSDVEARIKALKAKQEWAMEEQPVISAVDRVKQYFAKQYEEIEDYDPEIHGPLVTFEGLDKHEEVERYWVNEPYAFVVILNNIEKKEKLYYVVEPKLSRFEDTLLREIKDRLRDVLLVEDIIPQENKEMVLTKKVKELIQDYAIDLTPPMLAKILYYVIRDFVKFGPIDALQEDDRIEDISCNGFSGPLYLYHKQYSNISTNIQFNEEELDSFIIRLAQRSGKHISVAEPLIDATMPDGSRIQMTLSTHVTAHGGTFTIRKFSDVPLTPIDLINWGTFSTETMAYLWLCIENNKSLIFAGGTASGKTSSLNAVALFIPRQAKVISLEDTRELKLPHPNWIPAVTRDAFTADERGAIDMYELLRAALRQRPEYLLVGEVRGKEALTLFQAMSTGHTTFSTMHADSVASAIHRLENPPISVPRTMIQALNIISIQSQTYHKGKRVRRNLKVVEITDIDPQTRNIRTNDIFSWDSMSDKFQRVGESKAINEIMTVRAMSTQDVKRELINRQKVLEFLTRNNITDYTAVSTIIYEYSINPEKVLKKLKIIE